VDFSEKAIELARKLSKEMGIAGTFIHANLYELPQVLAGTFDIVFTSYGVLCWLPDLKKWAKIIAQYLKPGGIVYIVEGHPFAEVFQNEGEVRELEVAYPYFEQQTPLEFEVQGSYADKTAKIKQKYEYEWPHSVSEILNALIDVRLKIQFFHEFPFSAFEIFPFMEQHEDGWWRLKGQKGALPLMFSLKAIKE
jgi:SAM-dependent methyltransferase